MTREQLESRKEMIYQFVSSREYQPLSIKEMGAVLQVPAKDKKLFRQVLDELFSSGQLHLDARGKIQPLSDQMRIGVYMATQKGYGFVRVEGEAEDIFIPEHRIKGAMDGDKVQVMLRPGSGGKRPEGEIVRIVERGQSTIVGTYSSSKSFGFVVADNHKFTKDIYIAKRDTKGAVTGHKVVVEITDYGNESRNPEGRIVEILGHINDPGVDILSVIKAYGLPEEFPDAAMEQAERTAEEVAGEETAGRADYRDLQTVTIDGEDAKDLDDAVTLTKEGGLYQLGVHIADVSQYVAEHSPLDKEALKRGTSIYLVDRVIPMLPHKLSNGICSLNQGADRLALSCIMEINAKGEVVRHRIEESVIRVDRRMSYTSVHKIIEEKDEAEREAYADFIPMFELMYELAGILRERRFKRGSIDFDFAESKITLDERGKPLDVGIYERNGAHRLIEEFMLAANQTVAEEYFWRELPFLYRTHEVPDSTKIQQLAAFVGNFGYTVKIGADDEIHPKEIQKLIKRVDGTPEEALISRLALRSMKQAKYTPTCEGHFGLAMKYYCHFTSPIRRYPDLQIHRIIKEMIHGRLGEKRTLHYSQILPEVAEHASMMERRAEDAEREVEKMKKAEYMERFIGESFDGIISGITSWGMYVELPNTVEGMIRVASLPGDYYYFEEEKCQMVGERTHKTYKLGQSIRVTVDAVDKTLRVIDFVVAEEAEEMAANVAKKAKGHSVDTPGGMQREKKQKKKKTEKEQARLEKRKKSKKAARLPETEKEAEKAVRSPEAEKEAKGRILPFIEKKKDGNVPPSAEKGTDVPSAYAETGKKEKILSFTEKKKEGKPFTDAETGKKEKILPFVEKKKGEEPYSFVEKGKDGEAYSSAEKRRNEKPYSSVEKRKDGKPYSSVEKRKDGKPRSSVKKRKDGKMRSSVEKRRRKGTLLSFIRKKLSRPCCFAKRKKTGRQSELVGKKKQGKALKSPLCQRKMFQRNGTKRRGKRRK